MTKLDKLANELNDRMRDDLTEAAREVLGIEVQHEWRGFFNPDGGSLVTFRADGKRLTKSQKLFLHGFSSGYGNALHRVRQTR